MRYFKFVPASLMILLLVGCSSLWNIGGETRSGVSSSLVDYLYPHGEVPPDLQDTIPYLELPLRVGIAFVPGQGGRSAISEATRIQLLDNVKAEFVDREFIEHIEVIPDTYLRSSKGINGMQQVARLYGVDVMALVSYDQVAVSEDNAASFLYWTIVGSYVIKATSNEVQTFVDTAVFDVKTARLLFRAPGLDKMSDRSTLIESGEVVRKTKDSSFAAAMGAMTQNLGVELDQFRARVKEDPSVAAVQWKPGSGGGGTFSLWMLIALWLAGVHRGARLSCNRATGRAVTDL
ncbi:MAG: rhombotarget lipoprotein [Gammaproteobacteria bacterium]|nr:rhombotarget lipoprotein [Gammaproteobacteria bacterium]NNC56660.1 rhombotarget lipoprotein [Woeseiaceae bacterium]NNL51375.1 rhombotarget lipoprotein [Woeseiaceae bacterium]